MVLWVQIEEVKQIEIDLGPMISGIRLSAKLDVALFVAVEDIGGGTESRGDLAELVMLIGLVETSSDFVHGRHRASWRHVDPEG